VSRCEWVSGGGHITAAADVVQVGAHMHTCSRPARVCSMVRVYRKGEAAVAHLADCPLRKVTCKACHIRVLAVHHDVHVKDECTQSPSPRTSMQHGMSPVRELDSHFLVVTICVAVWAVGLASCPHCSRRMHMEFCSLAVHTTPQDGAPCRNKERCPNKCIDADGSAGIRNEQ
jgi:hypothetical protein